MGSLTTHSLSRAAFLYFSLLICTRPANAQCYHPNGTKTTDLTHLPCSNSASDPLSSICCATGRSNPSGSNNTDEYTADVCLPNGICQNRFSQNGNIYATYWREECTEQDWASGKCLNVCTDGTGKNGNVQMTPCDDTPTSEKWCCGPTNACCATKDGFTLAAKFSHSSMSSSASSSTSSATASASSSSSTSATSITMGTSAPSSSSSPPPTQPAENKGISGGAIAGIVIGSLLGIAAVFLVGFWLAKKKYAAKYAAQPQQTELATSEYSNDFKDHYAQFGAQEMHTETERAELADRGMGKKGRLGVQEMP